MQGSHPRKSSGIDRSTDLPLTGTTPTIHGTPKDDDERSLLLEFGRCGSPVALQSLAERDWNVTELEEYRAWLARCRRHALADLKPDPAIFLTSPRKTRGVEFLAKEKVYE